MARRGSALKLGLSVALLLSAELACSIEEGGLAPAQGGAAGAAGIGASGAGGIAQSGGFGTGAAGAGGSDAWAGSSGASTGGNASGGVAAADATSDGDSGASATGGDSGDAAVVDCSKYPGSLALIVGGSAHCYWRSGVTGKFAEAVAGCAAQGAYLVTLHSDLENELVRVLAAVDTLWIAATDKKAPTDTSCGVAAYGWVTGEPFNYAKWTDSNPDCVCGGCSGSCDCQHRAAMLPDGGWRDRAEGDAYYYVCEVGGLIQ